MMKFTRMNQKIRTRRNYLEMQRAIENAGTPAMREELLTIAQRHLA